jgi:hypothetical protein
MRVMALAVYGDTYQHRLLTEVASVFFAVSEYQKERFHTTGN